MWHTLDEGWGCYNTVSELIDGKRSFSDATDLGCNSPCFLKKMLLKNKKYVSIF
jgi:hypothetical protein